MNSLAAAAVTSWLLAGSHIAAQTPGPPIEIGTSKQFFVDDHIIATRRMAHRILNQPVKHSAKPIIQLEPQQQVGGKQLVVVSGSVIFDQEEKLFKMWYEAADYRWSDDPVCYATSKDGIHWELPKLGLYEYQGSKDNNIVFRSAQRSGDTSPAVFKDPVARNPQERYKMLHKRTPRTIDGVRIAFSPDGIHWTDGPDEPVIPLSDSPNSAMWDAKLKKYVAHTRMNQVYDGVFTREVFQSESDDFKTWTPLGVIMKPDERDFPANHQFYNMEWMPYEDVYFGFISVYHTLPGMETKVTPDVPWIDKIDIQLTFSRDGRTWQRAGDRQVFIPNGPLPADFDHSMIFVMQHPIVVGDEIWFYYSGFSGRHWATKRNEPQGGAVGLAKLRLDGFVSIDAGDGEVTTKPLRMSGDRLIVNANASEGSVRVEILDAGGKPIPGFTKDDADPIRGDSVRHAAAWKGRADVSSLKGKPITLRFHIDRSKVYSFVFLP
jgi:hypothetical protein